MNKSAAKAEKASAIITLNDLNLDTEIKKEFISPIAFSTWVRVLSLNWRQGTVACKGRSDVNYTNRKPWKQKGTGRARAGSARSPLWRGGGVIFGPEQRVTNFKIGKKVKRQVLLDVLRNYINQEKVMVVNWSIVGDKPKTSEAFKLLENVGVAHKKVMLFLAKNDVLTQLSFLNIPTVRIVFFDQPHVIDFVDSANVLVLKKDLEQFKSMVEKWS